MELKRDLLKIREKSWLRIIIGVVLPIIAIAWVVIRKTEYDDIRPFDWLYSGLFASVGIGNAIEGLGFKFLKLFGKAFILIDEDTIRIKTGVLEKEQNIPWNQVAYIDYKPRIFQITKLDQTTVTLRLSSLDYSQVQEMKDVIDSNAKEKGIAIKY